MNAPRTRAEAKASRATFMNRILTPAVRTWAYGVAAAAIGVAATLGYVPPETATVIIPLVMAILYVDKNGKAR